MNYSDSSSGFNIKRIAVIAALLLIVGYGLFNARSILIGPEITIYSPNVESETTESIVLIQGVAKNVTLLSLNNRPINIDKEGNFKERLLLTPGFNIIRFYGRDRFKQETTKEIKVYYREPLEENLTE